MVSAFGSIWVQSEPGSSLWRISARGAVQAKLAGVAESPAQSGPIGTVAGGALQTVAAGEGAVWSLLPGRVLKIDPATDQVVASITTCPRTKAATGAVGVGATAVAVGEGAVWVACNNANAPSLLRIDPSSETVTNVFHPGTSSQGEIDASSGFVWWIDASEAASVQRINPASGHSNYLRAPLYADFIVAADRRTWFLDSGGRGASVSDVSRRFSKPVQVSKVVLGVAAGLGKLWVNSGDLVGIDPVTGKVDETARLRGPQRAGVRVAGVAVLGHRVWVVDPDHHRIVGVKV